MIDEYIPLIVSVSQMAQRAIEQATSNDDEKRVALTMHYRKHSKQLVTALLQWGDRMNFSTCEYKDGKLLTQDHVEIDQPTIPYLEDVMKHLEKSYEFILKTYRGVENRHKELCKQIDTEMCRRTAVVPSEPSYEDIIVSKINQKCPKLRRTDKESLRENNVFLAPYVFDLIFKIVSLEKSETRLSIEPTSQGNVHRLTDNARIFGQGSAEEMKKMKKAITELIVDNKIKSRIKKYHELRMLLTDDKDIHELRKNIQRIYDLIYGGKSLGGYPACELCDPDYNII